MPGSTSSNFAVDASFAILLAAAMTALLLFAPDGRWAPGWQVAALVAAASVAAAIRFDIGAGWSSPMQVAQMPLWLAVPPAWLPVMVGVSLVIGQAIEAAVEGQWRPSRRTLLAAEDTWHAVGAATVLALVGPEQATLAAVPALLLVFAGQVLVDAGYAISHARLAFGVPYRELVRASAWVAAIDAALLPLGFLAAFALQNEPWVTLCLIPLIALFSIFSHERAQRLLQSAELTHAYRGTAQLMATMLKADDSYTGGEHTRGVVDLALAVGQELRLPKASMRSLEFGALLHDIGKLHVPNEILNKPGKLDEAEWAIIREHPVTGQRMLDTVGGALSEAGHIVRAHHERFDGTGYPDGLRGHDIPLEARIITVCDSFSAMTTDRPYRGAMSAQEGVAELERCRESQFDPVVVDAMHRVLADRGQILTVSRPRPSATDGSGQLVA